METVEKLFLIREADVLAQNPEFHAESLEQNNIGKKTLDEIKSEDSCFKISDLAVDGRKLKRYEGKRKINERITERIFFKAITLL